MDEVAGVPGSGPSDVVAAPDVDTRADDIRRATLMAGSRMLSYPETPGFADALREAKEGLGELGVPADSPVMAALHALLGQDPFALAETYVARFDLAQETTLHLTAHERGDDRERGPALLELAHLYRAAGFLPNDEQLSDYLPQLLELLAVTDEGERAEMRELEARVAAMCATLRERLQGESAYGNVLEALTLTLREEGRPPAGDDPGTTDAEDSESRKSEDGDDPEDMPYPLHYK